MKIYNPIVLTIFGILFLWSCPTIIGQSFVVPNKNFVKVVNVATSIYTKSDEWRRILEESKIIFKVPDCSLTKQDFPSTFNFTREYINVCSNMEALYPWKDLHDRAGELLVRIIREQYKVKLEARFISVNTSDGYFTAMKRAVDSGECDVAVSATNWNAERAKSVHFQCGYASSHFAYIRSELDPQLVIQNETDLNRDGLKVAVSIGTITDTWATNNLKKATIIRVTTYLEAFSMVLEKQVHSVVGDSMDLFIWMSQNKKNCSTCLVKAFGEPFPMGSFISNFLVDNSSVGSNQIFVFPFVFLSIVLIILNF